MDGWIGRAGAMTRLAELVAARICHDLGSPAASLAALMPQAADPGAQAVLGEAAGELRARLKLFAALFGPSDPLGWAEMAGLLAGSPMAHRVRFAMPALPGGLSGADARLCLVGALVSAEALPRGGVVHVALAAPRGLSFRAEGRQVEWSPVLTALLAGGGMEAALEAGARRVLAPWLVTLAAVEGVSVGFALSAGAGEAALLLTPQG